MTALLLFLGCTTSKEDPTEQDRDGDGFSDAIEMEAGTNPDSAYSHPLEFGDYNIGFCGTEPNPTGPSQQASLSENGMDLSWEHYAVGDIAQFMTLKDQYGQDVELYNFCGHHIMLVIASFT